jgi:hypothetical protein
MTQATVTADAHQAPDILGNLAPQVAFEHVSLLEYICDFGYFIAGQVIRALGGINTGLLDYQLRPGQSYAVNVSQRILNSFFAGYINTH